MSDKVTVRVQDVLEMIEKGKTRKQIQEHYGLNGVELKTVFQHPKLKGKRTRPESRLIILDEEDFRRNDNSGPDSGNTEPELFEQEQQMNSVEMQIMH